MESGLPPALRPISENKLPGSVLRSIAIVNAVAAVGEIGRGLVLPVIYLFVLEELNEVGTMIGPVIASFSFGRLGSSYVLGLVADKSSVIRVYYLGIALSIVGALLLILSTQLADPFSDEPQRVSLLVLLAARTISGTGSGSLSCCREDVRSLTKHYLHERTAQFAILSISQFAGFALSPMLVALVPAPAAGAYILGVKYNRFTQVGAMLVLVNVLVAISLSWYTPSHLQPRPPPASDLVSPVSKSPMVMEQGGFPISPAAYFASPQRLHRVTSRESVLSAGSLNALPDEMEEGPLRTIGVCLFLCLNFTGRGALALMEALTGRLYMATLPHDANGQVVDSNGTPLSIAQVSGMTGTFFTMLGVAGFLAYMVCIFASKKGCNEVLSLVIGFVAMGCGALVLALCVDTTPEGHMTVPGGELSLILGAGLVWSIGSPVSQLSTLTAFGKVLGKKKSSAEMGMLGSAGSCGRMLLPCLQLVIIRLEIQFWLTAVLCLGCTFPVMLYSLTHSKQAQEDPGVTVVVLDDKQQHSGVLRFSATPPLPGEQQKLIQDSKGLKYDGDR